MQLDPPKTFDKGMAASLVVWIGFSMQFFNDSTQIVPIAIFINYRTSKKHFFSMDVNIGGANLTTYIIHIL